MAHVYKIMKQTPHNSIIFTKYFCYKVKYPTHRKSNEDTSKIHIIILYVGK